ncbi:CotZ-related putative spore coat protein [Bacillus safensis]|uniref:CotZ-related putative spore coat protein n=1 Tax=Bacillus safensis TaxID=561879 RepID=UPI00240E8103|nr:CotZ-related putative spore coat protein [Bacillus safensis]
MSKLKEINNQTKNESFTHKRSMSPPFLLFMEDGEPFYSWVFFEKSVFKTCYFSLLSINEEQNFVVLELLVPCCMRSTCCQKVLYRSSSKILVDLSFLCRLIEEDLPVYYDALILKNIEPYHLHFDFSTSPCLLKFGEMEQIYSIQLHWFCIIMMIKMSQFLSRFKREKHVISVQKGES